MECNLAAQAGDRTKTAEELVVEQKARLEVLEAQRLKRMRGEEVDEGHEAIGAAGGYAARRRKQQRMPAGPSGEPWVHMHSSMHNSVNFPVARVAGC